LNEGDEFLSLVLKNPTNASLGDISAETLTIVDNDPLPVAQFAKTSYDAKDGKASIDVTLNTPSGQAVTIYWTTSEGLTGSVDVPVGANSAKINLQDLSKTVTLTLTSADNATLGTPSTTTVNVSSVVNNNTVIYIPLNFTKFSQP
jgi:hypothetical protein